MTSGSISMCLGLTMYSGYLVPLVGAYSGNLLATVDLRGIDFVLPGSFIVIFLEMLLNAKNNRIKAFGVAGCHSSTYYAISSR